MFVSVLSPKCSSGDLFQSLVLQCANTSSVEFTHSLMQAHPFLEAQLPITAWAGAARGRGEWCWYLLEALSLGQANLLHIWMFGFWRPLTWAWLSNWLLMKNCFAKKKKKFLRFFGKGKSKSQKIFRTGSWSLFTSLPGFPLNAKMKVIQRGALTSGDLRGRFLFLFCTTARNYN